MAADLDVLISGAGPAGAIAAWRLASAGVRVRLVDRESFPRHKLCGDTLNPGAVALLASLGLRDSPVESGLPLRGMLVTGPHAQVEARYGGATTGRAIERRILDYWFLNQAIAAGAEFEDRVTVREPIVDGSPSQPAVRGARVSAGSQSASLEIRARMTLAADGRASVLARGLGLATQPATQRRWAFGTYASGVTGVGDVGEMHIRGAKYIGVAPIRSDVCNVCVVTETRPHSRSPLAFVRSEIEGDAQLRARFAGARFEAPVTVLGPLALRATGCGIRGLLLAGDAAGFIDPMTGDGLHLAIRGGLLAAEATLVALESGDQAAAVRRLQAERAAVLASKMRFNRVLRRIVSTPAAVDAAGWAARLAPSAVRWAVRYAGDAA